MFSAHLLWRFDTEKPCHCGHCWWSQRRISRNFRTANSEPKVQVNYPYSHLLAQWSSKTFVFLAFSSLILIAYCRGWCRNWVIGALIPRIKRIMAYFGFPQWPFLDHCCKSHMSWTDLHLEFETSQQIRSWPSPFPQQFVIDPTFWISGVRTNWHQQ